MERIVVRRGRFLTYELLRRTFGNDPNVELIWDRRKVERRDGKGEVPDNRRFAQRRSPPPVQWDRLDYLFTRGLSSNLQDPVSTRTDPSA